MMLTPSHTRKAIRSRSLVALLATICLLTCSTLAEATSETDAPLTRPNSGVGPDRLEFGILVLDVDEISGQNQSFMVNCFLYLEWQDKRLAHSGTGPRIRQLKDVWHPIVLLANRQAGLRMPLPDVVRVNPDGTVIYRQQYVGPLSQRLRLHDFPMDTQTFSIHFIIADAEPGEVELVPKKFSEDLIGGRMANVLSLPDWAIVDYKVEVRPYHVTDTMASAGFAFEFVAKRYVSYFFWQAAMPLVLIVMMSWVPFWVDPMKAELQFAIAGSAVLTLIAFRFTLARLLPPLPYLTRMDLLTISGTVLVFGAFMQVVLTSLLAHGTRVRLARRVDGVCRVLFPAVFVWLIVWSLFL